MDIPLVIPHAVQSKASHGRNHRREIRLTEGAKAVLCAGTDVRIPRVQRDTERVKHQISGEVSLVEYIHMSVRAQTATITEVAKLRIHLVSQSSIDAILHLLEGYGIRHVIDARCIGDHLLAHFLCAQESRD